MAALVLATPISHSGTFPDDFPTAKPEEHGFLAEKLDAIWAGLEAHKTEVFVVMRNDRIIYERYLKGYTRTKPHYTASLAKALVSGLSLMLTIDDGLIAPEDRASRYVPQWSGVPLKEDITIAQLATHTSGIADAHEDGVKHRERTGWKGAFWRIEPAPNDPFTLARDVAPVLFAPGTDYHYSNPGIAMLTYCVTAARRDSPDPDLRSLLRHRIMEPLGISATEWKVGYNDGVSEVDGLPLVGSWGGAEFSANVAVRIGRLLLHQGDWDETEVLSPEVVARARRSARLPTHAGLGWWINIRPDFTRAYPTTPADTFWGLGAGGQMLMVIPSLNLAVVRFGQAPDSDPDLFAAMGRHLVAPLMQAFAQQSTAPYPPSPVIKKITWAPADTIVRRATGSDNWPLTWGNDDALYTAYGDGNGFAPFLPDKLSLGFARITGTPPDINADNIRSPSGEQTGDGRRGKKASGLLMVDGVLYLWARNADNAQLAWSTDHAKTWTWSDWRFTESFGAPTFLNFGRNYGGARDEYLYIYSPDAATAYERADQLLLARVPRQRVREREAYEFFVRLDEHGGPVWSHDIRDRGGVFMNPGAVYRTQVTYHPVLRRYLLNVIGRGTDTRYHGGFGVYDAPTPWGPWTTACFTDTWDVGPGEMNSFPTKWMSPDGRTAWLVFSGDDHFSLRQATFDAAPVDALSFAEEGGVMTIQFSGRPGAPGIPSWKAVLRRDNGGNITALHIPADHPTPVGSRPFWSLTALGTRNSEGVEGMMSHGRENYAAFTVERFEVTERTPEKIVIAVGGPSRNRHFEHERTYTFTPRGVAIEGWLVPNYDLSSIGFNPHWDLRQIADSHYAAVPMRTQGHAGWIYMSSSGRDGVTPLPKGVDYPLEVELRLRRDTPIFIRTFWDKIFDSHEGKRLFGHNNKDYTSPSGNTYYEKLLIIAGGPVPKGQRESFKVRYQFETRPSP